MGTPQRTAIALALASLAFFAACTGHHYGGGGATFWSFSEAEPNSGVLSANVAGPLRVGYEYAIFGHITDDGSDPYDGFVFFPEQTMELEFALYVDNPFADLELCFLDPFASPIPICWGPGGYPIRGYIDVYPGQEVHLVVSSLWDASTYTLEVYGNPPYYGSTAAEVAAAPEQSTRGSTGVQAANSLQEYLLTSSGAETPTGELSAPDLTGELIVVDDSGEVHTFPLGADDRGPFVGPEQVGAEGP